VINWYRLVYFETSFNAKKYAVRESKRDMILKPPNQKGIESNTSTTAALV